MAEDGKGEDTSLRGTDWEVVSLTASAYASAPGPKAFNPPIESNEGIDKGEEADSDAMFMSSHFIFPPYEHKHLLMDPNCNEIHNEPGSDGPNSVDEQFSGTIKSDDEIWKLKSDDGLHGIGYFDKGNSLSDHGMMFGELKALEEYTLTESDSYVGPTFSAYNAKGDISQPALGNESCVKDEHNDLSLHSPEYASDSTSASQLSEENKVNGACLPCEAWWKRHAISVYNHAKETNPFWSVFVAAAVMGFVILGQQWQKEKLHLQQLKWYAISDESLSRMLGPISRLKDSLVGGRQRSLLIRGGATST